MNIVLRITAILSLLLAGCTLYAQPGGLEFFTGRWNIEVWQSNNKTNTPDLTAQWIVEKGLDSAVCLVGHVTIDTGIFTREIIAYNSARKKYVRTIITNNGDYIMMASPGWKNDSLTWVGTWYVRNQEYELKEEIIKLNANELQATYYRLIDNKWSKTQSESIKRIKE